MKKLFTIAVLILLAACTNDRNPEIIYPAPVVEVESEVMSMNTYAGGPNQPGAQTEQEACTGTFRNFPNGCMDYCYIETGRPRICTMIYGPGCDCGPDQCFDRGSMSCVPNPSNN